MHQPGRHDPVRGSYDSVADQYVDFRFLEMADVADVMQREGFGVEAWLERTSYPDEVETRRGYLLARRQG